MVERMDQNGDGKLTPDGLAHTRGRMAFDNPAAIDTDKNGEISLAEVEAAIDARREQMREQWRQRRAAGSGSPDRQIRGDRHTSSRKKQYR